MSEADFFKYVVLCSLGNSPAADECVGSSIAPNTKLAGPTEHPTKVVTHIGLCEQCTRFPLSVAAPATDDGGMISTNDALQQDVDGTAVNTQQDQDVAHPGMDGSDQYVDQSQDQSQVAGQGGMHYGRSVYGGGLSYGFEGNGQLGGGMFRGGGGAQQQQQFQQGYGGGAGYGYPQFAGMNMYGQSFQHPYNSTGGYGGGKESQLPQDQQQQQHQHNAFYSMAQQGISNNNNNNNAYGNDSQRSYQQQQGTGNGTLQTAGQNGDGQAATQQAGGWIDGGVRERGGGGFSGLSAEANGFVPANFAPTPVAAAAASTTGPAPSTSTIAGPSSSDLPALPSALNSNPQKAIEEASPVPATTTTAKRTASWADIVRPEGFRSSDAPKPLSSKGSSANHGGGIGSTPAADEVTAMLSTPGAFPAPSAYTGGGVGYNALSTGPFTSSPGTSATAGAGAAGGGAGGGGGGNGSNPPLTGGPGAQDGSRGVDAGFSNGNGPDSQPQQQPEQQEGEGAFVGIEGAVDGYSNNGVAGIEGHNGYPGGGGQMPQYNGDQGLGADDGVMSMGAAGMGVGNNSVLQQASGGMFGGHGMGGVGTGAPGIGGGGMYSGLAGGNNPGMSGGMYGSMGGHLGHHAGGMAYGAGLMDPNGMQGGYNAAGAYNGSMMTGGYRGGGGGGNSTTLRGGYGGGRRGRGGGHNSWGGRGGGYKGRGGTGRHNNHNNDANRGMQNNNIGGMYGQGMMNLPTSADAAAAAAAFASNGAMFYPPHAAAAAAAAAAAQHAMMHPAFMPPMPPVQLPAHLSLINQANFDPEAAAVEGSRFFIMKTLWEEDIHRSIKYGVWSGVENGNRRLDAVWRESVRTNKKSNNSGSSGSGSNATPISAVATASSKQKPSAIADGKPVAAAAAAAASDSTASAALGATSGEAEASETPDATLTSTASTASTVDNNKISSASKKSKRSREKKKPEATATATATATASAGSKKTGEDGAKKSSTDSAKATTAAIASDGKQAPESSSIPAAATCADSAGGGEGEGTESTDGSSGKTGPAAGDTPDPVAIADKAGSGQDSGVKTDNAAPAAEGGSSETPSKTEQDDCTSKPAVAEAAVQGAAASPGADAPTETSGVGTTPAAVVRASTSPSENGRKSKGVSGKAADKDKADAGSGKDKKVKGGEKDKGARGKGGGAVATAAGGGAGGNNQIRKKAPVFLFFTVHQSGQFCGVAQMLGPLDHGGQKGRLHPQERWRAQFPVTWIIAKDLPNPQLKSITLPNNNNKPVYVCKDAQEVPYEQGVAMLKLFHNFKHVTSIVDDFAHYEASAMQAMHFQRARQNAYANPYGGQFTPQQHQQQHMFAQQQYQQYQYSMQQANAGAARHGTGSGGMVKKQNKKNKKVNNNRKHGGGGGGGNGSGTAPTPAPASTEMNGGGEAGGDASTASLGKGEDREGAAKVSGKDGQAPGADQAAGGAAVAGPDAADFPASKVSGDAPPTATSATTEAPTDGSKEISKEQSTKDSAPRAEAPGTTA